MANTSSGVATKCVSLKTLYVTASMIAWIIPTKQNAVSSQRHIQLTAFSRGEFDSFLRVIRAT